MPPAVRGVEVPGLVVLGVLLLVQVNGAVVVGDRAVLASDEVAFPDPAPILDDRGVQFRRWKAAVAHLQTDAGLLR